LEGLFYRLAYFTGRHYFWGWTLTRWIVLGLMALPFFLLPFRQRPGGLIIIGLVVLLSLAGLIAIWQVRRRGYLRFEPETKPSIEPDALSFPNKIIVRASGEFAVSGMIRYFVEEAAQYQTFQTRERVIMINIDRTGFLFLINSLEAESGWWYTFFTPTILKGVEPGKLHFGSKARPALRLTYQPEEADTPKTLYLTFDTPEQRRCVLADLAADQQG
jgi:hypothetical protein